MNSVNANNRNKKRKDNSNKFKISSLDSFSKIKKINKSKDIGKIYSKEKNKEMKSIEKRKRANRLMNKAKTPILSKREIKNKNQNNKFVSNNNSREKKILNDNKYKKKLFYPGTTLNIQNLIKRNYEAKVNNRRTIFQANNIFAKFKPKKKKQTTIICQEELQMKYNLINSKKLNPNNYYLNEGKTINYISNNNISGNNQSKINDSKFFAEIHPKVLQQETKNEEILSLTNNSTKINILNSTNNHSKSNNNLKTYSTLKQQTSNT